MSHDLRKAISWVSREVNSRALVIFSKTTCPYCDEAKTIFQQELGAAYASVKVIELDKMGGEASGVSSALLAISGMTTVPNIFLEGESIGGCSALKNLFKDNSALIRARLLDAGARTIRTGDRMPSLKVQVIEASEEGKAVVRDVDSGDLFRGKSAVVFGVPAAFSPSCSDKHVPSYLMHLAELKAKGIDSVFCLAVNDAHVLKAWAAHSKMLGKITLIADGNGDFTKRLGLLTDATRAGMGQRSRRFAILVHDATVGHVAVDEPMKTHVSTAEHMLPFVMPNVPRSKL